MTTPAESVALESERNTALLPNENVEPGSRWFSEIDTNLALSLRQKGEVLFHQQSNYQSVKIFDSYEFGRVLTLDDRVMLTENDEHVYHEMISHPAVLSHPSPKRVLVIGGGDGGTVREFARHPEVETITLVEIDDVVVAQCRKYLPSIACGLDHEKVNLIIGDGIDFVEQGAAESFDIIVVDSTDPLGPSEGLFTEKFYRQAYGLLASQGILMVQSESPRNKVKVFQEIYTFFDTIFGRENVHCMMIHVPTYMPGTWSLAYCSKGGLHPAGNLEKDRQAAFTLNNELHYYNEDIHCAAFALPGYVRKLLGREK